MKSKKIALFLFVSYALCIVGITTLTNASSTTHSNTLSLTPSVTENKNFVLEPLFATISGGILTSGVFFFFFKRMLDQYDKKHENNELDIKKLKEQITEFELTFTEKLYDKTDNLHQELNDNLSNATQTIMDGLSEVRETIQNLLVDMSAFKAEHKKCDYKAGDIKLLQTLLDNLTTRVEKKKTT